MKFFITLISIGFCLIALSQALSPEEKLTLEKKLFKDCQDKEKATDEDVNTIVARDIPTTRTGKCMMACVHETLGMIKDGKPSIEGAVAVAKIVYAGNEKAVAIASELMTECKEISDKDRCELATKFAQCGQQSALKHGIDPKKMI